MHFFGRGGGGSARTCTLIQTRVNVIDNAARAQVFANGLDVHVITNAIELKKKCCCVHHGFSHAVEASAKPCASCMCAKNRVDAFLLTHTRLCISAAEGKLHLFSFQIRKKAAQLCHIHTHVGYTNERCAPKQCAA